MTRGIQVTLAFISAAAVLALILAIAPRATIIASESSTEIYGVDILSITKNAGNLPEQQFAAH